MGVAQGADIGNKVKKNRPRGAACGAAAGRYSSLVFGGLGGRSPPDFCYLDNIEITEANRETLLLCRLFMPSQKFLKSIDKYVYVWYTILVSKRYFTCYIGRFSKCCFVILLAVLLSFIFGFCEGVLLLRKITITVDEGTLECLRAFREIFGISQSAVIRRAVWAYFQDKLSLPPAQKK